MRKGIQTVRINNKFYFVSFTTLLTALHLALEFFQGGVVTHYPLADTSNPGISNWWGLVTLPILTWVVLTVAQLKASRRQDKAQPSNLILLQKNYLFGGLAFGLAMGILWELGQEAVLQYLILLPWLMAPFVRIYQPETSLGFVLGMMYTFGGVLPIAFALVIQTIGYIIYKILNSGRKWLIAKYK